jgi:hypothetical protein
MADFIFGRGRLRRPRVSIDAASPSLAMNCARDDIGPASEASLAGSGREMKPA